MAAHMGDFAKNHMKRHGWKSGNGLGRNEDGISEAIKVKIKRGNAGVGHDAAEQFTFHWWDHVFNKAASNITVKHNENGVEVLKKDKESGIISNEKPVKAKGKKDALYSMFVKSATLTTEGEKPVEASSSSEDEVEEKIDFTSGLADDELFKACGGRTAHKGARHGLKANGKLQRLEEQERLLKIEEEKKEELYKIKDNNANERKKKKKKKSKNFEVTNDIIDVENNERKKKKRTKIGTEQMEEKNISLNEEESIADENVEKKDRKRKKNKKIEEFIDEELDNVEHVEKKSRKMKSKESESTSKNEDETLVSEDIDAVPKKRKKKKKRKHQFEDK
ncbi:G patch domain-containing protein 4-like [Antedon mediterranea]|uniref:G patch domain-containing protein 4-like n=1 Tax=Antedon mediterranea TaxID=105859 RepID=UPI003AF87E65